VTHGQDFSHMYAQPAIIHVQAEEEEDKGIEVRTSAVPSINVLRIYRTCVL